MTIPGNNLRDNLFMHPVYGPAFLEQEQEIAQLKAAYAALRDAAIDVVNLVDDTTKQDSGAYGAFHRLERAIQNAGMVSE